MSLTKNFLYNIFYQIILLIVPLATIPYIARVLGSNGVGIFAYSNSIVQWFILFGILGASLYGQREIAYVRNDRIEMNKTFWGIFSAKLFTVSISLILFIFFIFIFGQEYFLFYSIQVIYLISVGLDISWFFMGIEDFKKTVSRNMIVKLLSIIFLFVFVKTEADLWKYILILSCSELFGQAVLWISISNYIDKIHVNIFEIRMHIYKSFKIFIPQVSIQIYVILDKTMIGILSNPSEVGYYDMAQKVVRICLAVVTSLGVVMLPRISNEFSKRDFTKIKYYIIKSFKFATFLAVPMMFGLIGISNEFVPWFFGNEFIKTASFIIIMSPILVFVGWSNVLGIQLMIPMGREKQFVIAVTAGAILNFILNLIFIPKFYGLGASVASVLAELFILIIEFFLLRDFLPFRDIFKGTLKYWITSIFMCAIILSISQYFKFSHLYYYTLLQIIIGSAVYIVTMVLLKCEFTTIIIDKFKIIIKHKP